MNPMRTPRSVGYDTDTGVPAKQESRLEQHVGRLNSAIGELTSRIEQLEQRLAPITAPTSKPIAKNDGETMCAPARSVVCDNLANNTDRLDALIRRVNTLLDTIDL